MCGAPIGIKITFDYALTSTGTGPGRPKFLPVEVSEAVAIDTLFNESEEIRQLLHAKPARTDDKMEHDRREPF